MRTQDQSVKRRMLYRGASDPPFGHAIQARMKIIMQPIEQKGHLGKVSMQPPHQLKIKDLK